MSKARLIITAVVVEGRSKSEVARDYDVSRYWVQQLVKRWYAEGETAYRPAPDDLDTARTRSPPPSRTRLSDSARSCPGRDWTPARTPSAATSLGPPVAPRGRRPRRRRHRPRSPRSGGS